MRDSIRVGRAMVYLGDCRELLPLVSRDWMIAITDPPYGVGNDPCSNGKGRARLTARDADFVPIVGDEMAFDPSHLLGYQRVVLWGANHYADKLPSGGGATQDQWRAPYERTNPDPAQATF